MFSEKFYKTVGAKYEFDSHWAVDTIARLSL